jgi:hypothetical protein
MRKVTDFYNSGGMVLFTTRLPYKSSEPGKGTEVESLIRSIFPELENDAWKIMENKNGGKASFLPDTDALSLSEFLYGSGLEFDVSYQLNADIQYIHKVIDNRNVYFFANTGENSVQTEVTLRGKMALEEWDPHTGDTRILSVEIIQKDTPDLFSSRVKLDLKPYHSCFLVEVGSKE